MKLPLVVKQATRSMYTVYDANGFPIATALPKDIADRIALSVNVFDDLRGALRLMFGPVHEGEPEEQETDKAEALYQKALARISAVTQSG